MKIFDDSGRQWPIFLVSAFVFISLLCTWTVWVATTNPVYLTTGDSKQYKRFASDDANSVIYANIEFNKHYDLEYVTEQFLSDGAIVKLHVSDLDGNGVDDADIRVVLTHPFTHEHDKELKVASVYDGTYTFETATLPTKGRWNILIHAKVGEYDRFLNLKVDTRNNSYFEY